MSDTKHGWVTPRADGARARCGGPGVCATCDTEAMHEKMLTGVFGAPADVGAAQAAKQEAVLTDDDVSEISHDRACFFGKSTEGGAPICIRDVERRVLSKLRAPVADEPAFYINRSLINPETGRIKKNIQGALTWSETRVGLWQMPVYTRAALASAPVAGEARITNTEAADFADKHGMYYDMDQEIAGNHARALLAAYAAPQASEAVQLLRKVRDDGYLSDTMNLRIAVFFACQPQASEAVPSGIIDAARNAGFSFLRHADGSYTMQQTPRATAQASDAVTLTGIDPDRLRAIASSGSLTAMSNALQNVARRLGPKDRNAVCNASPKSAGANEFDDWLATHCDSDDLTAYERELARDAWCAALSAQPGAHYRLDTRPTEPDNGGSVIKPEGM